MLQYIKNQNVLFLDIETVPQAYRFEELSPRVQELFDAKTKFQQKEDVTAKDLYKKAGIFAEFGKIICISAGHIVFENEKNSLRIKSFYGDDEKKLLQDFSVMLQRSFNGKEHLLCAHNGKEFDFPWLCRRMLVNGIKIPSILDIQGMKPWEVRHIDTMELWKFGDYKHFTSLELLAEIFGIPSPKDDIKGSDVSRVYYEEKNLEKIVTYCQKDVVALTQLFMRFKGEPLMENSDICIV
ncbi:MAG: 3'-5' exonuclease [Bacteroidota bacterium]